MEHKHEVGLKIALGAGGTLFSFSLQDMSTIVSILAGLATLIYMVLNIIHRWRRLNKEDKNDSESAAD